MRKLYLAFFLLTVTASKILSQNIDLSQETNGVVGAGVALVPGVTGQTIFAVLLDKPVTSGEVDLTSITIHFSSNPSLVFSNPIITRSPDNVLGNAGDQAFSGSFVGNTAVFTASPLTSFGTAPATAAAPRYFFLTVDVLNTATGTIQPSVSEADFIVSLVSINTSSFSGNNFPFLTTTIGSLNSVSTNHVASSPLVAGANGNAVFGFSLTSGGTQTVTAANVQLSSNPASKLSGYSLVRSVDDDFATTGDNTTIGGLTFNPTGSQVGITGLNESITSTTKNYFLVANVNGAVTGATASITASLGTSNVTAGSGTVTGSTATGTTYSFAPITATIASLNSGSNNLSSSPLTAGATGQGLFGFSLITNSAGQTITVANVQFSSNPSGELSNFSLIRSVDADFSTTGDNTTIGGLTFTPSATQVAITGLSEALATSAKNYFLVADVNAAVTGATPSITPSLGTSNVTASTGVIAGPTVNGNAYSFAGITATVASLNSGSNNLSSSPLTAGTTGKGIFGFSLTTNNAGQTATAVAVQLTSDPAGKLSNFSLVRSVDADFSSTGDNTIIGGLTFTPSATQVSITGLSEALGTSAKNYFLVADVDPAVTGASTAITASLGSSNVTVGTGGTAGSSSGNAYTFQALTTTVTASGSTIPLVEGTTAQTIFSFTAASNGSQTLSQLDFIFSTDITAVLNSSNFVLKNGVATVGTPSYNSGTKTLTITGINVNLSTSQNFTLLADVLANGASSQTISLSTAGVTVTGGGSVNSFTTVTNTLNVAPLTTTITSSGSTIPLSAGAVDQQIFTLSALSNGSQSLGQLVFTFSVDIAAIFNTSSFELKNGASTVGTVVYNAGSKTVTVSGIGVSLSTTKNFALEADLLSTAPASSQTIALSTADVTVTGGGTVNAFTTVTNTLNVVALGATLTEITAGTAPVTSSSVLTAGTTSQVLTGFSVSSTGSQQMTDVSFNITGLTTQLTNIRLFKSSSAGSVGSSIATNATGNFTGLTQTVTTTVYYYLVADVLASAVASTPSITTAPTEANIVFSTGSKNTLSISRTFSFVSSQLSSIALNGGTSTGIDYASKIEDDTDLTFGNSVNIGTFRIIDPANDADNLGTTLTDITLSLANFSNVARIAVYDGNSGSSTEIPGTDQAVSSGSISFSGFALTANDNGGSNGTRDFTIRVSFKSSVTDNQVLQLTVTSATSPLSGSGFTAADAGGATTGTVVNDIEVTANRLIFVDPAAIPPISPYLGPLAVTPNPNVGSSFSVIVWATDANYNLDLDNTSGISLGGVSLNGTTSKPLVSGVANFGPLSVDVAGNYNLSAGDSGPLADASNGNSTALALSVTSLGVVITDGSPGPNPPLPTLSICAGAPSHAYTLYPTIKLSETDRADFATGGYFMLQLPDGFEFDLSVTPSIVGSGNEITINPIPNYYINKDILRFKYSISGTTNSTLDAITINGLMVKYPLETPPLGNDILVIDAGATMVKNAQVDAKSNGKIIVTPVSNISSYDFSVKALPGQPTVLKSETRFQFQTNGIILYPASTNPDSINYVFTGNGVSHSVAQSRYIFSPSSVGVGTSYPVTLTSTNPSGCYVQVTKTFQVYASSINGLQPEYCSNNNISQPLNVDATRYSQAQYYPAWNAATTYSVGVIVSVGTDTYESIPPPLFLTNQGMNPPSSPNFWKKVGYSANGDYVVSIPSYKSITSIKNNGGGSITITSNNHGFLNGASLLLYGYAYDAFYNFIFYIPYSNYVISNVTVNTFDIAYSDPNTGNFPNSFGTVYLQNPTITAVVNNGNSLTLTAPNHGLANGDYVRIYLNGLSDNGGTSTRIYDWYVVSGVTQNTFNIAVTATGVWSSSGFVDIFNYRFTASFTPAAVATYNSNLGTVSDIYVGFLVNDNTCVKNATNTCMPFVYSSDPVRLNQLPILDFNTLNPFYCKDAAVVTLTSINDGIYSGPGIADGGPGNKTATFSPATVATETNHNILFEFTDAKGCKNTLTKTTKIHDLPIVAAGGDADVCLNTPYQIGGAPTATPAFSNAPFTYSWDNGGTLTIGGSISSNPFATPSVNTTYTVTVTDVFACKNTDQITLTVFPLPIVVAGTSGNICSNTPLDLTSIGASVSGAATTATWSTGGNGSFQDPGGNPNVNFGSGNAIKYLLGSLDSKSFTLTLKSNKPPGPCPAATSSITVFVDPAPLAIPGSDQFICATDGSIKLSGAIAGSATNGTWTTTNGIGSLVNTAANNATYTPTNIELLGSAIHFNFTTDDPPGNCNADVKPLLATIYGRPTVAAGADQLICQGSVINLNGSKPAGSKASSTTWSVVSSATAGTINNPSSFNTTYTPDASEINLGAPYQTNLTFTITSDDPTGPCLAESASSNVTLYSTPPSPLSANAVYCVNDQIQNLTAASTINGSTINWYTQGGYPTTKDNTGTSYNTGVINTVASVNNFYVTQTAFGDPVKSFTGCESPSIMDVLTVNPLPVPSFSVDKFCFGDFMEFTDLSTVSLANNPSRTVQSWMWDFSDGDVLQNGSGSIPAGTHNDRTLNTFQNPRHQYQNVGTNYNVKLTTTSSDGCVTSVFANTISASVLTPSLPAGPNAALKVGSNPIADFAFKDICDQDVTKFLYNGKSSPGSITITNYVWDFGDATTGTNAAIQTHKYSGVGSYNANVIVSTNLNCKDTISRTVNVLPFINTFPYVQDFDLPGHGWFTEGLNTNGLTSWQLNPPNGTIINAASTGSNAWFTRVDTLGTYFNNERSVLNGPCIDVSVLPRPALSFDYWNSTDLRNDGAYMQVSKDNGVTWSTLGNLNEGLRWYDKGLILGLTQQNGIGQAVGQIGWSGSSDGWVNGKFSLEDYKTESKLRVRFVFGSNPDNPTTALDGFAIDHFKLDSLNRMVLVENFTNSDEVVNNTDFNDFKTASTNVELVKIQYHTGLKGPDPIFASNTADPNARVGYYGITNSEQLIPRGYLDGYSGGDFTTPWPFNYFSLHSLEDSPFNISITTVPTTATGEIKIEVGYRAIDNLPLGSKPVLHVVIVEKKVGSNEYVVRKMLPSAIGTAIPMPVLNGQQATLPTMSWTLSNSEIDPSQLAIVAFLQDLDSHKVYQTKINLNPANLPTVITEVEHTAGNEIKVFPSPADKYLTVQLPNTAVEDVPVKMFDTNGKLMHTATIRTGERSQIIVSDDVAAGVYLLQIDNGKNTARKKVTVIHKE